MVATATTIAPGSSAKMVNPNEIKCEICENGQEEDATPIVMQTSRPSAQTASLILMLATKLRDWSMLCRDSRKKSSSLLTRFACGFSHLGTSLCSGLNVGEFCR